jgi:hypothetical protein
MPDRPYNERMMLLYSDVAEARDFTAKALSDHAARLHVAGWEDDPDGITYDVRGRSIVGTLRLTRPD